MPPGHGRDFDGFSGCNLTRRVSSALGGWGGGQSDYTRRPPDRITFTAPERDVERRVGNDAVDRFNAYSDRKFRRTRPRRGRVRSRPSGRAIFGYSGLLSDFVRVSD